MARGRARPERRPGRQDRDPVPASGPEGEGFRDGEDPDDGSAGVREPRRPLPTSGAGARPLPEPELVAALPDPRY